ncbi:transcriptional regulator [Novosphingobium sp. G106]|uniref:GbsR/MarR family transcriptional regulator n=1 Tax=Novosphingobium sp. G106 TaxID=2849500 RepID=UPI001C2DEFFF|nr:transcriptional regulator [Novosphingobium sp. G106]MBV1690513.1 transcriptional regulator [Novosphingobium sp. G106]
MSKAFPSESDRRFMDEVASLMAPWGWSRNVSRIFAYLLLREQPATLDEISEHVGVAKSIASVAARELEQYGNARRHSQPGTKQILYSAPEKRYGPFTDQAAMMGTMAALMMRQPVESAAVKNRLTGVAAFLDAMREAIEEVYERPEFRD